MTQIANIILNDGKTTPVVHTFQPARTAADFAQWEDRIQGQYIGYWKLTQQLMRPKGDSKVANRALKSMHRIETPVLETVGTADNGLLPPPTLSHRPFVEVVFNVSERASRQDRKDLRVLLIAYLQTAIAIDAIDELSTAY